MTIQTTNQILSLLGDIKDKDKYIYFCYQIIKKQNLNKKESNKYIHLGDKELRTTFGDHKTIISKLKELGIINFHQKFSDDSFKKPYYYGVVIPKDELIDYEMTDKHFIDNINYIKSIYVGRLSDHIKVQIKSLNDLYIDNDVLNLYNQTKSESEKLTSNKLLDNKNHKLNLNRPKDGRVYSTITNLKKTLREALYAKDGSRLVQIDAKNAQLVILSETFGGDYKFNLSVRQGTFYEDLANHMGVDISDDDVRGIFKRQFIKQTLFSNVRIKKHSKFGKAFSDLFPDMFNYLCQNFSNKSLAAYLQKYESQFFIDNLSLSLYNSNIWFITIHDAILIKEKDLNTSIAIFEEQSLSFFNYIIKYSTEYLVCPTIDELNGLYTNTTCPTIDELNGLYTDTTCPTIDELNGLYTDITNIPVLQKRGKGRRKKEEGREESLYMPINLPMVGQNKKDKIKEESVKKITETINQLKQSDIKITIRKISEISGLAKKTVEKHYKAILADMELDSQSEEKLTVIEENEYVLSDKELALINKHTSINYIEETEVVDTKKEIINEYKTLTSYLKKELMRLSHPQLKNEFDKIDLVY
jgi:hypothetical protein